MKGTAAARKRAAERAGGIAYRSLEVRAKSVDVEARTVDAVLTSETPVPMWDYERWEMVPEVLRADGVKLPKQVPLLDSHARSSMKDQLGSVRNLAAEGDKTTGTLSFAEESSREFGLVRDGHADSVSAGYQVLKKIYVGVGETKPIGGRSYVGPVNVVTKWRIREVSLTPIAADEVAKLRAAGESSLMEEDEFSMDEKLRALLESRGMPKELEDDAAQRWAVDTKFGETIRKEPDTHPLVTEPVRKALEAPSEEFRLAVLEREALERAERAEAIIAKRKADHIAEAESICRLTGRSDLLPQVLACEDRKAMETVITKAREEESKRELPPGPHIVQTAGGAENFVRDLGAALIGRSLQNAGASEATAERLQPKADKPKGVANFRHASLFQMAEDYVRTIERVDIRGLSRDEIAIIAMFGARAASEILGMPIRAEGAYHTTGSFANLTMESVKKSLAAGWEEAPATWRGPMRQGTSVPDFKTVSQVRMGAIPNLPIWQDNKDPAKASFADAKEDYAVESRSLEIGFSYRTLVNDDLNAISRVPAQMGNAAARTVSATAWAQITSNPDLADGQPLFLESATGNRKQGNLLTDATTPPSVASMAALGLLLRLMRGENTPEGNQGPDVLNIRPKYLVVPAELETTANQLVNSAYDPASGVNTMVFNPTRTITPVVEPLLSSNSAYAWYLFADPAQIDTVEVVFMNGQESPVLRQWMDQRNLSQMWTVLQTFTAKAMNYRGIAKQKGEA